MVGVASAQPAYDGEPAQRSRRAAADGHASSQLASHLSLLLRSGGDERIWPDAVTGRSRYGTTLCPAPDEVWFSSSTASTIGVAGYARALQNLGALLVPGARGRLHPQDWLGELRRELLAHCGRDNAEVVLAASGTDAELIALAIAERLVSRPITNIVVAPNETGSGVPKAAGGLHFLPTACLGGSVPVGERLAGWGGTDIEVASVDIRTRNGEPRDPAAVDLDVANLAERALARGRGVLLHVLDTSKTGLSGLSREAASRLVALSPERVCVLVDACQFRCPAEQLRQDLDRGFMVLVTGSKFMGGPPLSGALLLPESIAARLREVPPLPEGLADYSARLDWPERLQVTFACNLPHMANLGAGMRWTAALAELQRFAAVDEAVSARFLARFSSDVHRLALATGRVAPLDDAAFGGVGNPSLVPIVIGRQPGRPAPPAMAAKLHAGLRAPIIGHPRFMSVGQPVQLGARTVLRVCASAPQVSAAAARMTTGASFEDAFAAIGDDLRDLFAKIGHLLEGDCM